MSSAYSFSFCFLTSSLNSSLTSPPIFSLTSLKSPVSDQIINPYSVTRATSRLDWNLDRDLDWDLDEDPDSGGAQGSVWHRLGWRTESVARIIARVVYRLGVLSALLMVGRIGWPNLTRSHRRIWMPFKAAFIDRAGCVSCRLGRPF